MLFTHIIHPFSYIGPIIRILHSLNIFFFPFENFVFIDLFPGFRTHIISLIVGIMAVGWEFFVRYNCTLATLFTCILNIITIPPKLKKIEGLP